MVVDGFDFRILNYWMLHYHLHMPKYVICTEDYAILKTTSQEGLKRGICKRWNPSLAQMCTSNQKDVVDGDG
jgi:hypothetical protein